MKYIFTYLLILFTLPFTFIASIIVNTIELITFVLTGIIIEKYQKRDKIRIRNIKQFLKDIKEGIE